MFWDSLDALISIGWTFMFVFLRNKHFTSEFVADGQIIPWNSNSSCKSAEELCLKPGKNQHWVCLTYSTDILVILDATAAITIIQEFARLSRKVPGCPYKSGIYIGILQKNSNPWIFEGFKYPISHFKYSL